MFEVSNTEDPPFQEYYTCYPSISDLFHGLFRRKSPPWQVSVSSALSGTSEGNCVQILLACVCVSLQTPEATQRRGRFGSQG